MAEYHLAQCNIGRLRAPVDSPLITDFVAALEPVNALADRAPGFVWRLQTDEGDATAIRPYDDELIAINMSVWQSLDDLAAFVYDGDHLEVMRRRREWFERMVEAYLVLWWIPAGTLPTVEDAKARLALLRAHGPTADAFTFRAPFSPLDRAVATNELREDWHCPA